MNFVEFQNFGLNAMTVSFIGTIFFTFFQAWGLSGQNKTIWKNKSGEAVSVSWLSYNLYVFFLAFIYALEINGLALAFNGFCLGVMHIPIIIGLGKFKGFQRWEKIVFGVAIVLLVVMIFLPSEYKALLFLISSFGNIIAMATQPLEIFKKKTSGCVDIRLIFSFWISTIFWVVYAFAVNNWVLQILCPSYLAILTITMILWFLYRKT